MDRLRRQNRFLERQATTTRILQLCTDPAAGAPLPTLGEVVRDLHDPPGYHPAHDQVVAIAVRPVAGQVFRWQQRLAGTTSTGPARIRSDRVETTPDLLDLESVREAHAVCGW